MADSMAARMPAARAGTGGPSDDEREELVEQVWGWMLVVLLAVLVTRLGLL